LQVSPKPRLRPRFRPRPILRPVFIIRITIYSCCYFHVELFQFKDQGLGTKKYLDQNPYPDQDQALDKGPDKDQDQSPNPYPDPDQF